MRFSVDNGFVIGRLYGGCMKVTWMLLECHRITIGRVQWRFLDHMKYCRHLKVVGWPNESLRRPQDNC